MGVLAATTTAWGDGDPLDVTLDRIATCDPDVTVVELSIGARPVVDGPDLIRSWSDRFEFIAHHSAPIGDNRTIRPDLTSSPTCAVEALGAAGIRRFSGHPPGRRHANAEAMWRWAVSWWETLAAAGIDWSVETMYTPRTRDEQDTSGGYHLSTPAEVWAFCDRAAAIGWHDPLLIDASHLHIGWSGGDWTEADIDELLASAPAAELHISTNDGRRDIHAPLPRTDRIWGWAAAHLDRFAIVVDEGRRRGDYTIGHVAAG